MLRLFPRLGPSSSWVIGCAAGFVAFFAVSLGVALKEVRLVDLRVSLIASGPPSCAGCFVAQVLHRIVEAAFSMFSFMRHLLAGRREGASFSVMLSVSLSLLESQSLRMNHYVMDRMNHWTND